MSATATPATPKTTTRSARKDVESAFAPIAQKMKLNFVQGEDADYTAQNVSYIAGMGGGLFSPITTVEDGGTKRVFPKLPPLKASELTNVLLAVDAVI